MRDYQPLTSISLAQSGACTLAQPAANPVTLDSPALDVMTDLVQGRRRDHRALGADAAPPTTT